MIFTPFLYFFAAASNEYFGRLGKTHNTSFSPARCRITSCRLHSNYTPMGPTDRQHWRFYHRDHCVYCLWLVAICNVNMAALRCLKTLVRRFVDGRTASAMRCLNVHNLQNVQTIGMPAYVAVVLSMFT